VVFKVKELAEINVFLKKIIAKKYFNRFLKLYISNSNIENNTLYYQSDMLFADSLNNLVAKETIKRCYAIFWQTKI